MSFKSYAKQAKRRLSQGFWTEIVNRRRVEYGDASESGQSVLPAMSAEITDLRNMLYCDTYEMDKQFELKARALINSGEIVTNPIQLLADQNYLATLSPGAKQSYLLKLSNKYRRILLSCESEHTQRQE